MSHLVKSPATGHLRKSASGHLVNRCSGVLLLGTAHHTDSGWDDHDTLAYEWNADDPPVLVPMDPWPYLGWNALYDDVWADLADSTDQLWADGEPDAGFRYFAHEIGQFGEYQTTEGILSAGATSFGFLTGPLKDYTVTNVKLTLRYTVVGAAAWAGLTYELRIRDTGFSAGLDTANSEGSQKTTWSQNADGSITKEITLAASDLFCDDLTDETHFLVAPVYTKPAFPGPASPDNDPVDVMAGLQGITATLTFTV